MDNSVWLLQIYEMADRAALQSATSLLSSMPGLTIDTRTCDRGSYLVAECADPAKAMDIYELVIMADPQAELIHSTTSPSDVQAVKRRLGDAPLHVSDDDLLGA